MDTLTTKPDTTGVISGMEGGKNLSSSPDMVSLTRLVLLPCLCLDRHLAGERADEQQLPDLLAES